MLSVGARRGGSIEIFYGWHQARLGFPKSAAVRHTGVLNRTSSPTDLFVEGRNKLELSAAWSELKQDFLRYGRAADVQAALTRTFEDAALTAFRAALSGLGPTVLVAAGDFARGEMFPFSTADILVVADASTLRASDAFDEFLRRLWANGVRPALRLNTTAEYLALPARNPELAFKLLDRKTLEGDADFARRLDPQVEAALNDRREPMLERLLSQVRTRHTKYRSTPAHTQPDVENGPGGLRDVRVVRAIRRLSGVEAPDPEALAEAARFLSSVRCFIEYRAHEERTVFDVASQEAMAKQFGDEASALMRRYFQHARAVFNATRRAIDFCDPAPKGTTGGDGDAEFQVLGGRAHFRDPAAIQKDPEAGLRLVEFVAESGVSLAPETEDALRGARTAIAAFCAEQPFGPALKRILELPHAPLALRALQTTDLLSAVFPEWTSLEGTTAADPDQPFTHDEQALLAVERVCALRGAGDGSPERFSQLLSEIDSQALALLAQLLHWLPADVARAVANRIQLPQPELDELQFVAEQEPEFVGAVSRDLKDPAAVQRIARRIGTIERLKLLIILTYGRVGVESVEPDPSFRLDQLWSAYEAISQELTRGLETDRIHDLPSTFPQGAEFIKGFPTRYLRGHTTDEIAAHIRLYELSRPSGVAVEVDRRRGGYQFTVVANDRPGLFGSFAGAISSFGLNIVKAEAFSNSEGVILDTFVVTDPKRALELNPTEAERLRDLIARIGQGKTEARRLFRGGLQTPAEAPAIAPRIHFDSDASDSATVVEIIAEDRPGLLYALATVFSSNACNIDTVLIDTKGRRAIDVFYVARAGAKLAPEFQEELKNKLVAACLGAKEAARG